MSDSCLLCSQHCHRTFMETKKWNGVEVTEILLDRPDCGNSLTNAYTACLTKVVSSAPKDRPLVLINAEETVFCGGLDRYELLRACATEGSCKKPLSLLIRLYEAVQIHPFPTVSLMAGSAAGGGVGLALVCDVAIALDGTSLNIPGGGYRELANVLIPLVEARLDDPEAIGDMIPYERSARRAHHDGLISDVVSERGKLRSCAVEQLATKKLWPPHWIDREVKKGLVNLVKNAADLANTPSATEAIAGGLVYEVISAIERKLRVKRKSKLRQKPK